MRWVGFLGIIVPLKQCIDRCKGFFIVRGERHDPNGAIWQLEKSCVVMTKSWLPSHATSRPPSGSLYWEEKINGKSYASPFGLWVLTPRNKLQAPEKQSNDCTCCTGHSLAHLIPTTSRFDLLLSSGDLEMSWESLVKGTVRFPKNT